jgi:carbon-monoxide dehydrogenase large subunit
VEVLLGDTDRCPPGTGAFVSRGGVGVVDSLVAACREVAERDLEPGTDVVRTVEPRQVFASGAHLAVVELDRSSGATTVLRYVAVEDCGTVIDPAMVAGQVRGGVATGIGKVLLEQSVFSEDGQPRSPSLVDYLVPLASDLPAIELVHVESPSPRTLLGSKGVGEAGTIGAFGAVANAVADALAPLGAVLTKLPYAPRRVHEALSRIQEPTGQNSAAPGVVRAAQPRKGG